MLCTRVFIKKGFGSDTLQLCLGLSKGRAQGCPSPTLNICRAGAERPKALGGTSLSRTLPYPPGPGPGLRASKQENYIFFNIVTKSECDQALSCLTLIAKKPLRKHPLFCLISIANKPLRHTSGEYKSSLKTFF